MTTSILQNRLSRFTHEVSVYPVSCEALANGRTDEEWLDAVLAGGAKIVQLRDKNADDIELYRKGQIFREKTLKADALFIVNNRLDIALAVKADGIHLGNRDLPVQEARKIAPNIIIGVSANTHNQAASAKERGASYFNIGPIFHTSTKKGLSTFLGVEKIKEFSALSPLPFTVMGGIKLEHVSDLTQHGAARIAVVTAITQAEDMGAETRKWITKIENEKRNNNVY